jgi:hypothetical protein
LFQYYFVGIGLLKCSDLTLFRFGEAVVKVTYTSLVLETKLHFESPSGSSRSMLLGPYGKAAQEETRKVKVQGSLACKKANLTTESKRDLTQGCRR